MTQPSRRPGWSASIVIPAHNEERTIGRLLERLGADAPHTDLEVVVVCNGCTDATADVAGRYPGARVVQTPVASKAAALRLGDDNATAYPRVYVDADVVIDEDGVRHLVRTLSEHADLLAVGPARRLVRERCPLLVRWYYDVWERLPQVQQGLFGRGVIALSRAGHDRVRRLPGVMSDDLAFSEAFSPTERAVSPEAVVTVHPPRTFGDLVRRRVRVHTGVAQVDAERLRGDAARTGVRDLLRMSVREPRLAWRLPVFAAVTVIARVGARPAIRRGDYTTWLQDRSSRV